MEATAEGALSTKVKELIAFGIAISVRCDGCIAHHSQAVVKAGATRAEVAEMIGVAILMGGGPASVYGAEALRAYDEAASAAPGG
ncbi:carboxymuconolactone decarboxylase family protein [Aliishimia ponticola]|uniref:Carboxymuconolactone decarboxylase family protein n=2 Tax=Aliishimia ponticola TaxID=2499833 RepID=A0A4S4NDA7_9RHOB|nr:carboxymuconolactone decarboxylase family protein [Aliishimia ponticola]